jgi:hypothetical protein
MKTLLKILLVTGFYVLAVFVFTANGLRLILNPEEATESLIKSSGYIRLIIAVYFVAEFAKIAIPFLQGFFKKEKDAD